ncbi:MULTISPECIES: sensor histidine kinase [Streptosporangium]|uniref:histidine kinase n=1 Tax=Streptosporangium brasiliense TaxID=47480 RepID=A0ABT9RKE8_9ACTN|nr:ATP-binding protein [Streptosporangium brasiliense]MDP9869209.1 signal transduction histidine kinase [Streptosporangium brasiliense]
MSGPGEARQRTESALAWTVILFRVAAFAEVVALNFVGDSGLRRQVPGFAPALAVLGLESALVVALTWRRRRVPPAWLIITDSVLTAAIAMTMTMVAGSAIKDSGPDFMLPYMLLVSIGIGVAFRTLRAALAATVPLAAAYLYMQAWSGFFWLGAVPHTIGFWVDSAIAWSVAALLRRNATELDETREQVARLAAEQERTRNGRILHDRVLQTMEALVRDGWLADEKVRAHVAAEARWLRGYVRGDHDSSGSNLTAALEEVVEQAIRAGLTVDLNAAGLRAAGAVLPVATVEALSGAVREALTNVRKYAGTGQAVVRARVEGGLVVVGVLDHGVGFTSRGRGVGLRESIEGRVAEIGGSTSVESAPGEGTLVELRVPL